MKVWITGKKGSVGSSFTSFCEEVGVNCASTGREEVDISIPKQVAGFIDRSGVTHIVNAAGYTFVDEAELYPERALLGNVIGPEQLFTVAQAKGVKLLHISSDYVFGQGGKVPFREEDSCFPVGVYGHSKREGEEKLLAKGPCCILRVSWVWNPKHLYKHRPNFFFSMLGKIEREEPIHAVNNQWSRLTYVDDLNKVILLLLNSSLSGIFHFANEGEVSRFEIAQYAALKSEKSISVVGVPSSAFSTLAPRPYYSTLNTSKICSQLGITIRSWKKVVDEYFRSTK